MSKTKSNKSSKEKEQNEEEKDEVTENNASLIFKMGSKTMIGGTAGYLCGRFFK